MKVENTSISKIYYLMKNISLTGILLFLFLIACNKETNNTDNLCIAEIVGFDLNCNTCIISFPEDSLTMKSELGESPDNCYQVVNLDKDNFKIGQKLKVKVRKAENDEVRACITMYPSFNYENIYVLDYKNYTDLIYNDTIELAYKDCLNDPDGHCYICFDSVLNDSRCPIGFLCFWAGNARVRFKFETYDSIPIYVDLYERTIDTLIIKYNFSFIDLSPYPTAGNQIKPEDFKARITIRH